MISRDSTLYNSYLETLKDRVFKILPLLEEHNIGIDKYISSLLFELSGLKYVFEDLENQHLYIILYATLEEIYNEVLLQDYDLTCLRTEILKSVSIVSKLQKGE